MKLITIKPIIFEDIAEDDPFAEPSRPKVSQELINAMEQREKAIQREMFKIRIVVNRLISKIPGQCFMWSYPGGKVEAKKLVREGKLILITSLDESRYVVPNTPESIPFVEKINRLKGRKYKLDDLYTRVHSKLLRDRRTVSAREKDPLQLRKRMGLLSK